MRYIGYHEDKEIPVKAGDSVTIRKGVEIRTTSPGARTKIAGRTYKITVHHILNGCTHLGEVLSNPSVRWAGSGGYWSDVDINDIPEVNE